jgi:18S rRNA (guanine1575-N7)-methyltransferase
VLQFYPDGAKQAEMITTAALRVGFSGGLVVDYPNSTRAKKYFLVLAAGPPETLPTPRSGDGTEIDADYDKGEVRVDGRSGGSNKRLKKGNGKHARTVFVGSKRHPEGKGVAWIKKKKEQARNRGKDTARDSKYTGRKRKERI